MKFAIEEFAPAKLNSVNLRSEVRGDKPEGDNPLAAMVEKIKAAREYYAQVLDEFVSTHPEPINPLENRYE